MKVIELADWQHSLKELISLAEDEVVVLREPNGKSFALAHVDDFDVETRLLAGNAEFMEFLRERSAEAPAISLEELRKELSL